jgi:hypothetical protein
MASRPELPAAKPKGVVPGRATVIKLADPALIAQWRKPAPAGQVDVASQQPFQGSEPAPPTQIEQAKAASKGVQSKGMVRPKEAVAVAKPSIKPAIKEVHKTPDLQGRYRPLDAVTLDLLPSELKAYQIDQSAIESANPYMTDTTIYTPQSRKSFYRFITDNYSEAFRLAHSEKGKAIDQFACAKLEQAEGKQVEAFLYQKFIREYIRNAGPYRGILVYHGLGSGKTCSAIAAAEALYGTSEKKIIVMTPFSLRANFMSEISFCGFRHFNVFNHWVKISLTSFGTPVFTYAMSVLSMKSDYLTKKVLSRADPERRAIWIPDFTKESNYNELSQEDRNDVREQLTHMIDSRIKFISYNGITAAELKRYACLPDPETGKPMFDDAVIVIDEVHNLSRLMQGQILPYITEREGSKRKIEAEPIVPGRWEPKLCGKSENYKRAYLFYRLLTDARNSKIIGLSGTPIINFPEELGILANVLGGYIECAEFSLLSTNKQIMQRVKEIAEEELRVDIVRFREGNQKMGVLISTFQEGYQRVNDGDSVFIGVQYNKEAQEGIREIYPRIKAKLIAANIKIEEDMKKGPFVSYPRLPIDDETFKREFINPVNLKIINEVVLKKRLSGLISYYKGSKEEYMPRVTKDEIIRCEMSDYTLLEKYTPARTMEIQGETKKEKGGDDVFAAVEMFAKMKNPSSYRFRSRALCNFAFPKEIERPFPGTREEELEEEREIAVIAEDASEEVGEVSAADAEEAAKVAEEERLAEHVLLADGLAEPSAPLAEPSPPLAEPSAPLEAPLAGPFAAQMNNNEPPPLEQDLPAAAAASSSQTGGNEEYEYVGEYDDDMEDESDSDEDEDDNDMITNEMEGGASEDGASAVPVAESAAIAAVPKKRSALRIAPKKAPVISESSALPAVSEAVPAVSEAVPAVSEAVPLVSEAVSVAAVSEPVVSEAVAAPKKRVLRIAPKKVEVAAAPTVSVAPVVSEVAVPIEPAGPRVLSYRERIEKAMRTLDERRAEYLMMESEDPKGRLATYSTKLASMLENIEKSKGSNLVYSQFKTVEGLGVLGVALKANGYDEIKIVGTEQNPKFSDDTIASFRDGLGDVDRPKRKRFISFTGEGSKEQRALVLNIFNGNFDKLPAEMRAVLEPFREKKNTTGDICWVIGITGAGAEGISLKCCRSVHIMEPYWNNVRLDQVKGRAIRICSHKDLPFKDREVEIYTYYTVFSEEQKRSDKIDQTIRGTDNNETSDEKVYYVSIKKDKINQEILKLMKESAVDCELNAGENDGIQCFRIEGQATQYLFDPNLEVDKIITSIELKEVRGDLQSRVSRALDVSAPAAPVVDRIKVIRIRGIEYLLKPAEGTTTEFILYGRTDTTFIGKKFGTISSDPSLGKYTGLHLYEA